MNLRQHLFGKLAEECTEVGHIAHKIQQFGMHETRSGQPLTNAKRAHEEIDDLTAIIEMLNDIGFGYEPDRDRIEAKKEKVVQYLKRSVELGMVEHQALREYEGD